MQNIRWRSRSAILCRHDPNLGMQTTDSALRDTSASWVAIPKCEMVFRCAAILVSADDYR